MLPLTINDEEYDNCYVCSPYAGAVSYPLYELCEVDSKLLQSGLAAVIHSLAPALRMGRINRVVCVNNWLLSTNLYPEWGGEGIQELTTALISRYPQHAIIFRSLNHATNEALCEALSRNGFLMGA